MSFCYKILMQKINKTLFYSTLGLLNSSSFFCNEYCILPAQWLSLFLITLNYLGRECLSHPSLYEIINSMRTGIMYSFHSEYISNVWCAFEEYKMQKCMRISVGHSVLVLVQYPKWVSVLCLIKCSICSSHSPTRCQWQPLPNTTI